MQMPHLTDIAGLAGVASAITASLLLLPGAGRLSKPRLAILPGTVFALSLIPFGDMPLAAYVRGATGDLSITTLTLLWCALLRPWWNVGAVDKKHRQALLMLIVFAAAILYPFALGIGMFDTYRLGYGNPLFVAALLLIALAAWFMEYALVSLCIALATLAWSVGWYESDNLWDYLLDPFSVIYALCVITIQSVRKLMDRERGDSLES